MTRTRIALADDHQLVLDGLESLLSSRYQIVARATNGEDLYAAVEQHEPDVVVSDVSMPREDGISATRRIMAAFPQTRVVLVTMNDDPMIATQALEAGARGYVLKSEASRELFTAIDAVVAGQTYRSLALSGGGDSDAEVSHQQTPPTLTDRQVEVLRLLGRGCSMKEVAAELHISPRTVAFHKYRIMEQLGISTNAELVRRAMALGLTPP